MEVNYGFTAKLLELLKNHGNKAPILITSSIQAEYDNPYGTSKRAGEELLFNYYKETDAKIYIYRLPNLFGKWSKPNYNSVVATFCYNIARNLDIKINNPEAKMTLCYIDDVLEEFLNALQGNPTTQNDYCVVPVTYTIELKELANRVFSFNRSRENLEVPNMSDELTKNFIVLI